MRHNMNQPVKPRQTLILFESSSRTEDTGKYTYDLQIDLAATATNRDVSTCSYPGSEDF